MKYMVKYRRGFNCFAPSLGSLTFFEDIHDVYKHIQDNILNRENFDLIKLISFNNYSYYDISSGKGICINKKLIKDIING